MSARARRPDCRPGERWSMPLTPRVPLDVDVVRREFLSVVARHSPDALAVYLDAESPFPSPNTVALRTITDVILEILTMQGDELNRIAAMVDELQDGVVWKPGEGMPPVTKELVEDAQREAVDEGKFSQFERSPPTGRGVFRSPTVCTACGSLFKAATARTRCDIVWRVGDVRLCADCISDVVMENYYGPAGPSGDPESLKRDPADDRAPHQDCDPDEDCCDDADDDLKGDYW